MAAPDRSAEVAERPRETVRRLRAIGASGFPIFVSQDRPSFGDETDVTETIDVLQAASAAMGPDLPIGLIIIDTARKAFRGLRENDSDSVGIGLEAVRKIQRAVPSAAVVMLHHLSKDGTSARGSGAILADADLELTIASRAGRRTLEVTGANAVEEGQVLPFDLTTVTAPDGTTTVVAIDVEATEAAPSSRYLPPPGSSLSPDASAALAVLNGLGGRQVAIEAWRSAVMVSWSDRRSGTRRQAFSKARDVLSQRGTIILDGESVSVSGASATVSAGADADGLHASALGVSAPLPIGEGADAADTDSAGAGRHTTAAPPALTPSAGSAARFKRVRPSRGGGERGL